MKRERGYIGIDFTGLIVFMLVVGAAIGAMLAYVLPWLWSFIKPLLHALTA
jgi:hypothetical protein